MTALQPINGATKRPQPAKLTLASIVTVPKRAPMRLLVWGVSGVGKTTFAAAAPNPIFLCTEEGAESMSVARFPLLTSYEQVGQALEALHDNHDRQTLVIDSLTALETLIHDYVCRTNNWRSIDVPAYGAGYARALDEWAALMKSLDQLRRAKNMHVILIGHADEKPFKNPEGEDWNRYCLQLRASPAKALQQWSDAVLFARHEVFASTSGKRVRGISTGARVLHTQWNAAFDAKNRYDLPDIIPLSWDEFDQHVNAAPSAERLERLRVEIREIGTRLEGTEHAGNHEKALKWAGDDVRRLSEALEKLRAQAGLDGNNAVNAEEKSE